MGVVYDALDKERGARVALKFLPRARPDRLFLFKQEFRTLADVSHPNLVSLYELFSDRDRWFFTMELIEGEEFGKYVGQNAGGPTHQFFVQTVDGTGDAHADESKLNDKSDSSESPVAIINDSIIARLRSGIEQLAIGVRKIHSLGVLHRDIKPGNVLVQSDGRVVLLDFGLVESLSDDASGELAGTIGYMAPEQAAGGKLTTASDWYSVGAMIYECLTGRRPFEGSMSSVIDAKQTLDPIELKMLNRRLPADLCDLTMRLLSRDPSVRPNATTIFAVLGGDDPGSLNSMEYSRKSFSSKAVFVGRNEQLEKLSDCFEDVMDGGTSIVLIRGESRAGKSALVQRFLESLPPDVGQVTLAGRCYEQESVAFKAFDKLVDVLTIQLAKLDESAVAAVLPRDVAALARIFPVFQRIPAVVSAPSRTATIPDQIELRRRAFTALRELLARFGDRRALILMIDDLQWGDVDSANLLDALLQPPDPPSMLVLGTFRSEDEDSSECLKQINESFGNDASIDSSILRRETISLTPLSYKESEELALRILERDDSTTVEMAKQIVKESRGSPYFLSELAINARDIEVSSEDSFFGQNLKQKKNKRIDLDDVIWSRI